MQPITDKEKNKILEAVRNAAEAGLANPVGAISTILLNDFGWPLEGGRIRAKKILEDLAASGEIECRRNGWNRILSAKVALRQPAEDANRPAVAIPRAPERQKPRFIAKKFRPMKKGRVRRIREANEKGDRNEMRLYILVRQMLAALATYFPEIVAWTECSRSGNHNPDKGKIVVSDSHGEDVRAVLAVRSDIPPGVKSHVIILQGKSSQAAADNFNSDIKLWKEQKTAALKKAIVVNHLRPAADVVRELLDELISLGLLPSSVREKIIDYFPIF